MSAEIPLWKTWVKSIRLRYPSANKISTRRLPPVVGGCRWRFWGHHLRSGFFFLFLLFRLLFGPQHLPQDFTDGGLRQRIAEFDPLRHLVGGQFSCRGRGRLEAPCHSDQRRHAGGLYHQPEPFHRIHGVEVHDDRAERQHRIAGDRGLRTVRQMNSHPFPF